MVELHRGVVFGCEVKLIVEANFVASFLPSKYERHSARRRKRVRHLVDILWRCADGAQFSQIGELFPTHIRAKFVHRID